MSETPVEIFCSNTLSDERWQQRLEKHLSFLQRQGLIASWHNHRISPREDQTKTIDTHLNTASIILLLISPDFLASDYSYGIELKRALERHEAGEARVIPILLRPVDWQGTPFAHLQALPMDAKPITSWANQEDAFSDVVAGIRRNIEDLTLLLTRTPRAPVPSVWNVPYQRNPFFTGREDLLTRLAAALRAGQTVGISQPQAVSGLGGVGKTQIALEYAYRYQQDYDAVLWTRADTQEALISGFVSFANLLSLPLQEERDQLKIVQAVKVWLTMHTRWLLILDNADDLFLLQGFLPPAGRGHTLLTTRAASMGRLAQAIEVDTLDREPGALFLLRRTGRLTPDATLEQATASDRASALLITQELGGLPLALDQAGAYIEEIQCSLADYLQFYRSQRAELLKARGGLVPDHPEPVATTWSLSFEKIKQTNSAAADLLHLCAFLAPDAIPEELIREGASHLPSLLQSVAVDVLSWNLAIAELLRYSLIRRDPESQTLSLHRLVQAVLKDAMSPQAERIWAERAVLTVHMAFPSYIEPSTWPQCQRLLAHAEACADLINQRHLYLPEAAHLLNQTGRYLYARGLYAEAEPLFGQALSIYEQQVGPDHPDTATSLNNLALLYRAQGKYAEAEPLFRRALAIYEQQVGPDHPDTATSLSNLAGLYQDQSNYEQAEPLYQRALVIDEKIFGPEHPAVATDLNNLAELYRAQGKYELAESLSQRALAISEQRFGHEHPNVATSLNNLALLYQVEGKYEQAEALLQRALAIYERLLGQEHPHTLAVRRNHTTLLQVMGK